jgi:fatty acyl-CoA reductase
MFHLDETNTELTSVLVAVVGVHRFVMQLVDLYGPFSLFKGCFDDVNLNKLRLAMAEEGAAGDALFNFDPRTIDWDEYFYRVHIPGAMKYVFK